MSLSLGIIGLPNVGKSTLFNALLKRQAALAANYPFATIEPNLGVVDVADHRLQRLAEIVKVDYGGSVGTRTVPEKIIPATVNFYDIAGLVKGASQGEGLGNAFLSHIREVDALIHVIRAFSDDNVVRAGAVSPGEDMQTINTELILADLQTIEKVITRLEKITKSGGSENDREALGIALNLKNILDAGQMASNLSVSDEEKEIVARFNLLTAKPVLYVYNIDESEIGNGAVEATQGNISVQKQHTGYNDSIKISAKIESEIASIQDPVEKEQFMDAIGISQSGLDKIISAGYSLLGLQSFFTLGPKEVRAWTIKKGSTAPQAAGKIHTDFEKGFISAEIIAFDRLDQAGSEKKARTEGLIRLEGKKYVMKDGDCVEFHFSV